MKILLIHCSLLSFAGQRELVDLGPHFDASSFFTPMAPPQSVVFIPPYDSDIVRGLHVPVQEPNRRLKLCVLCQMNKTKTKSGWRVNTVFRCSHCQVALCTNNRNCFGVYHGLLFTGKWKSSHHPQM